MAMKESTPREEELRAYSGFTPRIGMYFIGLDIGRVQDHSAIAVIARHYTMPPDRDLTRLQQMYMVTDLRRFPLGTSYAEVEEAVAIIYNRPLVSMKRRVAVVDQTGVGAPVVENIRRLHRVKVIGINITGGNVVTQHDERTYNVPKVTLVTCLVSVAQRQRLKILPDVEAAEEFKKELETFGYKIDRNTGNVSYESLENIVHDDLVIAVALPLWYAETIARGSLTGRLRKPEIVEAHDPWEKT